MTTKTAKQLFNLPVLFLAFFMATALLCAQSKKEEEEYFDESKDDSTIVNPFPKLLGFTTFIGSNTVVDRQELAGGKQLPISYKALFTWGFGVLASPVDFLSLQVSYMSSKSTVYSDLYDNVSPDYQKLLQITSHWTPIPYNRINVYGSLGTTLFFIESNKNQDFSIGINTGLGLNININSGLGLLAVIAEWDLNFSLKNFQTTFVDNSTKTYTLVNTSTYYSIVRVGLALYPDIF